MTVGTHLARLFLVCHLYQRVMGLSHIATMYYEKFKGKFLKIKDWKIPSPSFAREKKFHATDEINKGYTQRELTKKSLACM